MSDRAIREADAGFGRIMGWLDENGRSDTDVMVVSDHGYSTILESVDVESRVRDAGFSGCDALGGDQRRERLVLHARPRIRLQDWRPI